MVPDYWNEPRIDIKCQKLPLYQKDIGAKIFQYVFQKSIYLPKTVKPATKEMLDYYDTIAKSNIDSLIHI